MAMDKAETSPGKSCPFMDDNCLSLRFVLQSPPLNMKRLCPNVTSLYINLPDSFSSHFYAYRLNKTPEPKTFISQSFLQTTIGNVNSSPVIFFSPTPVDVYIRATYPQELSLIKDLQTSKLTFPFSLLYPNYFAPYIFVYVFKRICT